MSTSKSSLTRCAAAFALAVSVMLLPMGQPARAMGLYDDKHYRPAQGKPRSIFRNPVGRLDTTIPRKLSKLRVAPVEFKDGLQTSPGLPKSGAPRAKNGRSIGSPAPLSPTLPPAALPKLPPLPSTPPTPPLFSPQATPPTPATPAPVTPVPVNPAPAAPPKQ